MMTNPNKSFDEKYEWNKILWYGFKLLTIANVYNC